MTGEAAPPENGTEDAGKQAKTLEQRYIELLEEKISRLETELKGLKEKPGTPPPDPKKEETPSSTEEATANKEENVTYSYFCTIWALRYSSFPLLFPEWVNLQLTVFCSKVCGPRKEIP